MATNTSTVPSIRELVAEAFENGCTGTLNAREYVERRVNGFDRDGLLMIVTQMLPTYIPVARGNMRHGTMYPNVQPRRTQGVSRVQAYRDSWARKRDDLLCVDGVIKRFGDCTRTDLFHYADYLDEKADEIHRSADYYRVIADRLDAEQTVDSLESEVER